MSYIEKKVEWIGHFYCIGGILCFIKYHIRSTVWTILSCFILAGGIFVRWGRKDCSGNNTELIYSGKHLDCICLLRGAEKAHRCVAKYLKQRKALALTIIYIPSRLANTSSEIAPPRCHYIQHVVGCSQLHTTHRSVITQHALMLTQFYSVHRPASATSHNIL